MLEFCPLCEKNGYKRNVVLTQINLDEAVWLCESTECPWPFGYQDFTFVSRRVGEAWSAEWGMRKPSITKLPDPSQISLAELGLDTPPVTPGSGSEVTHKETIISDNICSATGFTLGTSHIVDSIEGHVQLRSNSNKSKKSFISDCGSLNSRSLVSNRKRETATLKQNSTSIGQSSTSSESLNNCNNVLANVETPLTFSGSFSLNDDFNSESTDKNPTTFQKFNDASEIFESLTDSIFNPSKSLENNLHSEPIENFTYADDLYNNRNHKSSVKRKKFLIDNAELSMVTDSPSCSATDLVNIVTEFKNASPFVPANATQKTNSAAVSERKKQYPTVISIRKTNMKLVEGRQLESVQSLNKMNHDKFVPNSSICQQRKTTSDRLAAQEKKQAVNSCENLNDEGLTRVPSPMKNHQVTPSDENFVHENGLRNIETRTVVIDGLPPISLSYEIPSLVQGYTTVPSNTSRELIRTDENVMIDTKKNLVAGDQVASINIKVEPSKCQKSKCYPPATGSRTALGNQPVKKPLKRSALKLAKYQGFNLGSLKKPKTNSLGSEEIAKTSPLDVPLPGNVSTNSDSTHSSCITTSTNSCSNSVTFKSAASIEDCGLRSTSLNSNSNALTPENDQEFESYLNVDKILDDLILNETEDSPPKLEDDWLLSLLN